jgi:hypothetical protein
MFGTIENSVEEVLFVFQRRQKDYFSGYAAVNAEMFLYWA